MANLEDLIDPEYGLQQDEWSLTRPKFGEHGQLEVIGWSGKYPAGNKIYAVVCKVCSEDQEVFGNGQFGVTKSNLLKGVIPCGCGSRYSLNQHQATTLCTRAASGRGFEFLGFVGEFYKDHYTKVKLSCKEHGEWSSTRIGDFLRGAGCARCSLKKAFKDNKIPDKTIIDGFISSHNYHQDTKFKRSDKLTGQGYNDYWWVTFGCCGTVTEAKSGNIRRGSVRCKCKTTRKPDNEIIESFIRTGGFAEGTTFRRSGRKDCRGQNAYWFAYCPECGCEGETTASSLQKGQRPCECSKNRQKEAYINLVKINCDQSVLKFGVAVNTLNRLYHQNNKSIYDVKNFGVWEFDSKKNCIAAERECKQTLECGILTREEMPDGYTETTWVYNLEKIISIYEKHGGVRIDKQD